MEPLTFSQFITTYNRLYKETDDLYRRLAKHYGLSDSAFWILYLIEAAPQPITQTELVNALFLSKQTINSALKSLEQSGHIRLTGDPAGGRGKYLHLTELGKALAERTVRPVFQMEERAFHAMTAQQQRGLLELNRLNLELLRRESEQILGVSQEDQPKNDHQII